MKKSNLYYPIFKDSLIQVEITDFCNLSCYFCQHSCNHFPHQTKESYMKFSIFKKIIDDLTNNDITFGSFAPFWLGESLMHPALPKMVKYYFKYKEIISKQWILDTNGTLLSEELIDSLLTENNNFHSQIRFSIDAVTRATYKKIRGKDFYPKLLKNIDHFLKKRKSYNLDYPEPIFQFIITKENIKEAKRFSKLWNNRLKYLKTNGIIHFKELDSICIKENQSLLEEAKRNIKNNSLPQEVDEQKKEQNLKICAAPFKSLIISKDGDATVCCIDNNLELKIGNVKEKSIYDLWINNPELNQFRIDILRGKYTEKKCQSCQFKNSSNIMGITKEEAIEFLKAIGKEDEIKNIPLLNRKTSFMDFKWFQHNLHITLETNATCNLRCRMCSQSIRWVKGGHITFEKVKKLIDDMIREGIHSFSFSPFYRGEPLLCPGFDKIIRYLIEKSNENLFEIITFHTNATLLTQEKTNMLLDLYQVYPNGEIFFSIDAATKETYRKIRRGGDYSKVTQNIEYFIQEKGRRKINNLKMVFQFIVQDENINESRQFIKKWGNILKKNNERFEIARYHGGFIPMHEYGSNVIFFRRKEPKKYDNKNEDYFKELHKDLVRRMLR